MSLPAPGEERVSRWLERQRRPRWPDLRAFIRDLEDRGELRRVRAEVDCHLEITALCRHSLRHGGPALLFDNVRGYPMPVLGNLFGTTGRVARALGLDSVAELRELGRLLAAFKAPHPPESWTAVAEKAPHWRRLANLKPRILRERPSRNVVMEGPDVDLASLPVQTCWPDDAGPLVTFGLVVTRGSRRRRLNVAVYRQQLIGRNRLIMRWLRHRGGAQDLEDWNDDFPGRPFPIAVVLGADPAMILAAVAPVPDALSELELAGLLRGARTDLAHCSAHHLLVPANAEIVLEGHIHPEDTAREGPFCDHTGYYNTVDDFPVFTVERVTMRDDAIYHTTFMGRPPDDELSVLAMAMNEIFVPLLQSQFPEIVDFYLPPAACSCRIALVSIRKQYPGHARRIMLGVWSWLRQFTCTKAIVVTDEDIDLRDGGQVLWAMSTRADPSRDLLVLERTPIDTLDFASPVSGLGGKLGIDACNKWPGETDRPWGRVADMPEDLEQRIEALWSELTTRAESARASNEEERRT